jgi:hypothetical protein
MPKQNPEINKSDMNQISENWQITLQSSRRLTVKNLSSSLEYSSTHFRKAGSAMSAISEGSIMRAPVLSSNWSGPVHGFPLCVTFGLQRSSKSKRKYSFEKVVSALLHGPQYPLASVWPKLLGR